MPDKQIQILSTKVINEQLIQKAAQNNLSIDVVPFISTEAIAEEEMQANIAAVYEPQQYVIFTSVNAVQSVGKIAQYKDAAWRVCCTSGATSAAVKAHFPKAKVLVTADDAKKLAVEILNNKLIQKVLFFCGDMRRDELPTMLNEKGVAVNEILTYRTVLIPTTISAEYDGVLFFSPSAVESYMQKNVLTDKQVLFAVGNTTAEALRNYKNTLVICDKPSTGNMIDKVISHFTL
ncbi:MAG: uroporphyrinogen-III synthase [Bacteroidota bacterium]